MKTVLQVSNINKMYGTQTVLRDASVNVSEGQKIGVIGRNGAGKSTLCKIILGQEEADSGTIDTSRQFRLAYLEQHDAYQLDETVEEFLTRYTGKESWQCGKVAARFRLDQQIFLTRIGELSGGFRTRVKLASMLLRDPNFLILDEPTNFLDLSTLILLEEFLKTYQGGYFVVSHDREFLKKTCDHTLEIENGSLTLYPGNVHEYLVFKDEQKEIIQNYNRNIQTKQKQLKEFVDRFRAKATKAAQAKSKQKQLDKLKTIEIDHPLSNVNIRIPQVSKRNTLSFSCRDLSVGYPDFTVAENINLEFVQGDHIAILGDNGQGKTTFLRTIAGDLNKVGGEFKWGHNLKTAYYAQHVFSSLNPKHSVYDHLYEKADHSVIRQEILDLAGCFLFKGDEIDKSVSVLSGGERARLILAGLLLTKSEVLLLDEPTNHLDFETVEALGEALRKFHGTVFFVSHDRTFAQMLANRIIEVESGRISGYPGSYEDYVYAVHQRLIESEKKEVKQKEKTEKPVSYQKDIKQLKTERIRLSSQMKKIQSKIDERKKERDEIYQMFMSDAESWSHDRNQRYEYLERMIRKEEDEWYQLAEKQEKLNEQIG